MSFYPPKISERFHNPQNAGKVSGANAVGAGATFICGAVLKFTLKIEAQTKEIQDAKFQTSGCGFLIAAADVLAGKIIGKNLTNLHGSDHSVLETEIEAELGEFSELRRHCLDLCLESLQNAFIDFRAKRIEEFAGEKALICTCFGVSEETIEHLVAEKSLAAVESVSDLCNAGDGCGACRPLIQEIIDNYWREHF